MFTYMYTIPSPLPKYTFIHPILNEHTVYPSHLYYREWIQRMIITHSLKGEPGQENNSLDVSCTTREGRLSNPHPPPPSSSPPSSSSPPPLHPDCLNAWSSCIVALDLIDKFPLTGENKGALVALVHINGKLAGYANVRHN